jgi:HSP20 family protein
MLFEGVQEMLEVVRNTGKSQPGWDESTESHFSALNGLRWRMQNHPRFWRPPMDVYETEESLVVRVEIAGMQENDFSLTQKGRLLLIQGIRNDQMERRAYHQMEIPFGEFQIELELPTNVDESRSEAMYRQGFLKITLPKVLPIQIRIEEEQ